MLFAYKYQICVGYFQRNAIVTLLPITGDTPFFINLCVIHF